MSEARAQRDRRLIQRTAALLSEDYPFVQLTERICDALCSELDADLSFVALADEGGVLRIEGVVATADGVLPDLGPRSPSVLSFKSKEPVIDRGHTLAVPIIFQDRTLGVLTVSASSQTFDEQDERLVGAIARYLAVAARNQRVSTLTPRVTRSPQLTIVAAVVVAVVLTALIGAFTAVRVHVSYAAGSEIASATLGSIIGEFDDYILDARQLAATTVSLVSPIRRDRASVERSLTDILRSSRSETIYGIGVWYEPYVFDGSTRYYGPYAHWTPDRKRVVVTYEWMRSSYDFHHQPWYLQGKAAGRQAVFTDPYFDTDHVYVTAARPFYDRGRFAGVVTVDSILPTLQESLRAPITKEGFAAVVTQSGKAVVTTGGRALRNGTQQDIDAYVRRMLGNDAMSFSREIPYTKWVVRYYLRRSAFAADAWRLIGVAIVAALGIWLAAVLAIVVSVRSRKDVQRAVVLQEQQHALEREIAERVRAEERLRAHAYTDDLTGLPNRGFLLGQIAAHLEALRLDAEQAFAVLFIDIDRFNIINDSLGHATGDRLLSEFGARLNAHTRPGDVLARMSGDEFVLLARLNELADARRRAAEILQSLRHPFTLSGTEFFVSASIGIALSDTRYDSPSEILRDADVAMYESKKAGRATFRIFDRSMHADALEKLALETELRHALERGEIFVEYQPIVALADGHIAGFEALARWRHPTRGRVMPDVFIKLAEQIGMIVELDERVIAAATLAASDWAKEFPDIFVAVNFSAAHLARVDDLAIVRRALDASGLRPQGLKIEITESAVMESAEKSLALLTGLRELGVPVSIDDFGTGYSSLSQLQQLPAEELKIDRAFISTMLQNEKSAEIVRTILAISRTLHLAVTAEGVETMEQAERLAKFGVEYAQGAYFGMSVEHDMALRLLRTRLKRSVRV